MTFTFKDGGLVPIGLPAQIHKYRVTSASRYHDCDNLKQAKEWVKVILCSSWHAYIYHKDKGLTHKTQIDRITGKNTLIKL